MNSQDLKAYLKRHLAMDAEIDPDGWITKNGRHININTKTGEVNVGMGGALKGVKVSGGPKKTGEGSKSQSSTSRENAVSHYKGMAEKVEKELSQLRTQSFKDPQNHELKFEIEAKQREYDKHISNAVTLQNPILQKEASELNPDEYEHFQHRIGQTPYFFLEKEHEKMSDKELSDAIKSTQDMLRHSGESRGVKAFERGLYKTLKNEQQKRQSSKGTSGAGGKKIK